MTISDLVERLRCLSPRAEVLVRYDDLYLPAAIVPTMMGRDRCGTLSPAKLGYNGDIVHAVVIEVSGE